MDRLEQVLRGIQPERTSLMLGAGASVSSGAPLAIDLCRFLESELAAGEHVSDDLPELCSLLEQRKSRVELVEALVSRLDSLSPSQELLTVAKYRWGSIYTTNFDQLVEKAFSENSQPLSVVRSHYDWEAGHQVAKTTLYKLHGCISEDRSRGDKASMVLTLQDYAEYEDFRTMLFDRLAMELSGGCALIIGHSIRDPHLQVLVNKAIQMQRRAAAPGRVFLILDDIDDERASLWRSRGLQDVFSGGLEHFAEILSKTDVSSVGAASRFTDDGQISLPYRLIPSVVDLSNPLPAVNARRLFYGGEASYGDIEAGLTFERDCESGLRAAEKSIFVILGAAGTGKSTLARRLLLDRSRTGSRAFEHRPEFPFDPELWLEFESHLRASGEFAWLLIDNAIPFQRQVNSLVSRLHADGHLNVIMTAETSAWRARQKDPRLFKDARHARLEKLSYDEVRRLRYLVVSRDDLRPYVDREYLDLGVAEQDDYLLRRCRADMFVCLKALFSSESLDDILLREFAFLGSPYSEVYRLTAGLQAAGGIPHRQMVLRMGDTLDVAQIPDVLQVLEGVVEEQTEHAGLGIYSWRTRHDVVATVLSKYKFPDDVSLKRLLEKVVSTANPSYFEEARFLRELSNAERGIRALPQAQDRIDIYRMILKVMPTERVARHRLIRELINLERIGESEVELNRAVAEVGLDPPLQRYRVLIMLIRSRAQGILEEDRFAILTAALNEAETGMEKFPDNKYMYFAAADVAEEMATVLDERGKVEWAKLLLKRAYEKLLDPEISDRMSRLYNV